MVTKQQNKPLDWDENEHNRPSAVLLVGRVIAALSGIALIIGSLLFALIVVLCSQTGSTSNILGLPVHGALQAILILLPSSVLGLLLVEFGATGRTSVVRTLAGIVAFVCILATALFMVS